MLHENLQTNIIREDRLAGRTAARAIEPAGHVSRGGVQLGEEEAGLGAALVADDVPARA